MVSPALYGGGGIRTHEPRQGLTVFKTVPFVRSGTPPVAQGSYEAGQVQATST